MKIHVGTSGYAHKEWKGVFYPEKIAAKEMLPFYARHLAAVEINNTFYHMPTGNVLTSWSEQVPDDFVFAIKAPQAITHVKRLKNVDDEADYLFRTLPVLGQKLGPVLFQFPHFFHVHRPLLELFLELIPPGMLCAFDFRSPSWHTDEIADLLRSKGCSLCMEDMDEAPVKDIVATASWGYLRLRRSDYDDAALKHWLERIRGQKWEKVFVFFKHEEEEGRKGPETAIRFRAMADALSS